jgi:hypothetical protein
MASKICQLIQDIGQCGFHNTTVSATILVCLRQMSYLLQCFVVAIRCVEFVCKEQEETKR